MSNLGCNAVALQDICDVSEENTVAIFRIKMTRVGYIEILEDNIKMDINEIG